MTGLLQSPGKTTGEWQSTKLNGKSYFYCLSTVKSNYVDPLVFASLVPYGDVLSKTSIAWVLSILALTTCVIVAILLSARFSIWLYAPIRDILDRIPGGGGDAPAGRKKDELALLDDHIDSQQKTITQLKSNMSSVLPLIYNRYIMNILYHKEYDNTKLEPMLTDFAYHFPYPYFTCAVMVPQLTTQFYNDFTEAERGMIMSKLTKVLNLTQDDNCVKYVFHIDENQFCVIVNSLEENVKELLCDDFSALQQLLSFDKEYALLYIAFGGTCDSIQGLHVSWEQANEAMSKLSVLQGQSIAFYEREAANEQGFVMGSVGDNRLSGSLYKGDYPAVCLQLTKILEDNTAADTSAQALKDLYTHLYELGDTMLRRKGKSSYELMKDQYVSLSVFIHNLNNLQRSEYISAFYKILCEYQETESDTTFDLSAIKAYVDEHYCEEIYLESMAEHFRTTPKYMSLLLKQALGVPFKQYTVNLRIAKAKELLMNTDKRIEDIAAACGFANRNSFIRAFKQVQGVPPSEYRGYTKKK